MKSVGTRTWPYNTQIQDLLDLTTTNRVIKGLGKVGSSSTNQYFDENFDILWNHVSSEGRLFADYLHVSVVQNDPFLFLGNITNTITSSFLWVIVYNEEGVSDE